jgi:hypothetical protein
MVAESKINADKLNNVGMKLIDFKEEGREYLKMKLNYLETNNMN